MCHSSVARDLVLQEMVLGATETAVRVDFHES